MIALRDHYDGDASNNKKLTKYQNIINNIEYKWETGPMGEPIEHADESISMVGNESKTNVYWQN